MSEGNQPYENFPLAEINDACVQLITDGATIYQKFTCAECGARQTMDVPNVLYTSGSCDKCGHVTDIEKDGCNYMLVMSA